MKSIVAILAAGLLAGCAGPAASPGVQGTSTGGSPGPGAGGSGSAGQSLDPSLVPAGLIAYMRVDADKVERYFTVDSLGANEHALFETTECACIRWSPDGSKLWTVTEAESSLYFTTLNPDGSDKVVHKPNIPTLKLVGAAGSSDGRHVALFGWDDTDPSRLGIWTASPDLTGLRQVTGVPAGVEGIDPMGMSADGSYVYFHGDLGRSTENGFHHAGNFYVIRADGTGLRQLNPPGTKTESTGEGVSLDGGRVAFTAWQAGSASAGNALFIVDGPEAEARRVTDWTPNLWGASWSASGDLIALSQSYGGDAIASLIRPDGTGLRPIAPAGDSASSFGPTWTADGAHFLVRRGTFHSNDLWIMDLEGHYIWQVTHKPGSHDVYGWQPG